MSEPVEIARCMDVHQAEILRCVLDGHGIFSYIDQPFTGSVAPHYLVLSGGVRLFVASEDLDRARDVLASAGQDDETVSG